ncbi:MAG: HD domain-containing protein [Cyanobacteria bacterium]|nr:HD domain-containing protein [Cyanobacteriota bacterium]MDA1020452.1 HD domain-containing protein [Cyanobacteriota bacterium]
MSRTYRDPIHQEISLDSSSAVEQLIIDLIDTREFQRLRWIRQLGTGWFTFHGAEASRFGHSLGAMHVARMMFNKISQDLNLDPDIQKEYYTLVLCAALLHDIGHGPFSHSCEKVSNVKHEKWTALIIQDPSTQVQQKLEQYQEGLASKIVSVLNKSYPTKFICNIVSSQLDSDRFDYLLRDSFYSGTAYGHFDLNRVIGSIKANLKQDCLVVGGEKGMLAVEDYLYARYSMYMQVYQHKKCLASDSFFNKLLKRAMILSKHKRIAYIEESLYKWLLTPEQMTVQEFLEIDDTTIIHHIKHWAKEKDIILKDLSKRFLERKLFKSIKVKDKEEMDELIKTKSAELRKLNLDPDYYLDNITIASNPYSFYNPNEVNDFSKAIYVEDQNGQLNEISTVSHVVASLVQNSFANSWLIGLPTPQSAPAFSLK